ncbi:MAG: RNA 2',3'-cyclic phosphodiesterase [Candidatus Theseobacter exili]|nr:RNA 2',3'-cyclic phosphodiesterase [Candidatus Theseobacter exili]
MMGTIRCFIAVEFNKNEKKILSQIQKDLSNPEDQIHWVSPDNLHLTLKFLGDVEEEKAPVINEFIQCLAGVWPSFGYELRGLGSFPNIKLPRILWIGSGKGKDELIRLAREVDRGMGQLRFKREGRKYTPHITIGRVKYLKRLNILREKLAKNRETLYSVVNVDRISLIRSTLTPKGPVHEVIGSFPMSSR